MEAGGLTSVTLSSNKWYIIGFSETPMTIIVGVENGTKEEVTFRCHHQRLDAVIGWQMNGLPHDYFADVVDGSVRESNGTLVYTLTIPARIEYNETEVVCKALFPDGSPPESAPPAILIITGK